MFEKAKDSRSIYELDYFMTRYYLRYRKYFQSNIFKIFKKYVVCTKNKTCYIDIDIVLWNKSDLRYMLSYTMTTLHI